MKAKNIILLGLLVWAISFVFCISAWSISVFSVGGTVRNADGSLAESGLTVVVENEKRSVSQTTTTGGQTGEGKYAVAFVGVDDKGKVYAVAEVGDVLKITVKDAAGKDLASKSHTVTETDIDAGGAVIDITISTSGPDITSVLGIASVVEDTGGQWKKADDVITITVTQQSDGKEAVEGSFKINERIINQKLFDDGKSGGDKVAKDRIWTGKYAVVAGDYVIGMPVIATLMDAEGKTTSKESSTKVNIDAVPPPVPKGLTVTGNIINKANSKAVEIRCQVTANASVIVILQDKAAKPMENSGNADAGGSFKITVDASALADGNITVTAYEAADLAGNLGEKTIISVQKDTVSPPAPTELKVIGGVINQANVKEVEVTGKASTGAVVTVTLQDIASKTVEKSGKVDTAGVFKINNIDASTLADGNIDVTASEAADAAGNPGEQVNISVLKDTIPPPPPTELNVTGGVINQANVKDVEVTGEATAGASLTITLQDTNKKTVEKSDKVNADGTFKIKLDASSLLDGEITVTAFEDADTAGNPGSRATISVQKDTGLPFQLKSPALSQEIRAGESAIYVITVERNKEGFDSDVSLIAKELPDGVTWRFNPEVIKPSQGSQLTVTTPDTLTPKEYPFLALGLSGNLFNELPLTLKILSPLPQSFITVSLFSVSMEFGDKVKISGKVILPGAEDSELIGLLVTITLTSPEKEIITHPTITTDKGKYSIELTIDEKFLLDKKLNKSPIGKWDIKAEWNGNDKYKPAVSSEETFTVTKGTSEIKWESFPRSAKLGDKMTIVGRLYPHLEGQKISLGIIKPDGIGSKEERTTDKSGIFQHEVEFNQKGRWTITASWGGNDLYKPCSSSKFVDVVEEFGKVIIVLGGGDKKENKDWDKFNGTANYVYEIFKKRSFKDEDIYYMNPSLKQKSGIEVDAITSKEALEQAITKWAKERVNATIPLFIYLMSHNVKDTFLLEKHGNSEVYLTPKELATWLDTLQAATGVKKVTVIIEACYSGTFIEPLIKDGRVIITSTDDKSAAFLANNSSFSRYFFDNIYSNYDIRSAFRVAKDTMGYLPYYRNQKPQLEADNELPPNKETDYDAVKGKFIPTEMPPTKKIEILDVSPPQEISLGKHSAFLWAKVSGADRVWGEIVPPDYVPPQPTSTFETPGADFETVEFKYNADKDRYECTYDKFNQPGVFTVVIYAEDFEGELASISPKIIDEQLFTLQPPTVKVIPKGDVNGDGMVKSNDAFLTLKIAAGLIEPTEAQKEAADMNDDGEIKSNDALLILRKAVGLIAAPAMVNSYSATTLKVRLNKTQDVDGDFHAFLKVDNPQAVGSADVKIVYDAPALVATGVDSVGQDGAFIEANLDTPGVVQLAMANPNAFDREVLATIHFKNLNHDRATVELREIEFFGLNSFPLDAKIIPDRNVLLQNFPNPFNPETWIPYQLSKDSDVTISIYNIKGQLVRKVELGHRVAGFYVSRTRAAYWDGKNEYGERTASGLYFYTIKAGIFIATRKMILVK